jgi:hypothetical protein
MIGRNRGARFYPAGNDHVFNEKISRDQSSRCNLYALCPVPLDCSTQPSSTPNTQYVGHNCSTRSQDSTYSVCSIPFCCTSASFNKARVYCGEVRHHKTNMHLTFPLRRQCIPTVHRASVE